VSAIALALAASLAWGTADFSGGLLARGLPVAAVALVSQATGFAALVCFAVASGEPLHGHGLALGAIAGVAGGAGLAAFYRALAVGTMTIVAPIAACGAVLPLALALAGGDRPGAAALAGALVALAGAVMASIEERAATDRGRRDAIALAAVAAVLLGLFVFFLGRGGQHGGA
jgi:uncharacterized membrane protein